MMFPVAKDDGRLMRLSVLQSRYIGTASALQTCGEVLICIFHEFWSCEWPESMVTKVAAILDFEWKFH